MLAGEMCTVNGNAHPDLTIPQAVPSGGGMYVGLEAIWPAYRLYSASRYIGTPDPLSSYSEPCQNGEVL